MAVKFANESLPLVDDCLLVELPRFPDARGSLSFLEGGNHIPFVIKRAYWIYDVPGGETRGRHAYRELEEFIIALSGSFEVLLDDGRDRRVVTLNRGYVGLYLPNMIWRHLRNFSTNAVCLILASQSYSAADYLRDYEDFLHARVVARR